MKFRIDLRIFLFFILFIFTRQVQMYLMVLIFGFIHELGHLFAGLSLKMKPEKVEITPFGFSVSFKLMPNDFNTKIKKANLLEIKKLIIAIAGPLTNVIILCVINIMPMDVFTYLIISIANIVIILYNLLPIYPMDGGRILKGILHIFFGKKMALKYIHKISFVTIILLTIMVSVGILYFQNIAMFIAIIYLWYIFIKENKSYKLQKEILDTLENIQQ